MHIHMVWGYGDSSHAACTSKYKKLVVVSGREIQVLFHDTVRPVERPGALLTSCLPAPLSTVFYKNLMFSLSFCAVPAKLFIFLPDFAKLVP